MAWVMAHSKATGDDRVLLIELADAASGAVARVDRVDPARLAPLIALGEITVEAGEALILGDFVSPVRYGSRVWTLGQRDGWLCHYCRRQLGPNAAHPEVEHVIPRSRGGSNRLANLVLACGRCNREKDDRTPIEWPGRPCCKRHADDR